MAVGFRKLPSPRALLAFEAAARNMSFTEAAKELNVTRVAISRHVSQLEAHLETQLFQRHQNRIELTRAGKRLARAAFQGFQIIVDELEGISNSNDDTLITIATTSGVSTYWMMPNIGRYRHIAPAVDFRMLVSHEIINLSKSDVDLAIRYGTGNWAGANCTLLCRQTVAPLCSRNFLKQYGPFEDLNDLLKVPLLDYEAARDPSSSWPNYFRDMGRIMKTNARMSSYDSYINFVQAVLDGQGVGLLGAPLMKQFLDSGVLVPAIETEPLPQMGYYLCQPEGASSTKVVEDFKDWLMVELFK